MFIRRVSWTLLAFIILVVPVLTGAGSFATDAHAASSRVALIKELKGTVKVRKAGGSKEFTAFVKMSLNEGDTLSTGTGSSAVLQFANGTDEDDKMTVSANTKLTFSKLSDRKGTTTKVSMWSGSAWVDVKSIVSKNDEFMLETPTAVMGVRGTHLLVSVDPATGNTRLIVAAGVVRTETTDVTDRRTQDVYPTQRAVITDGDEVQPGDIYIAPVDLSLLMDQSDANIVTAILGSASEIVDENARYSEQYSQQGLPQQLGDKPEDLNRFKSNTENLLGAIADQAVKNGLLTQERLDRILTEVKEQSGFSIDLSKKQLAITEAEKNKQEEQRKLEAEIEKKAEEMRKKELELRKANEALQRQLEEEKKKQAEAKRKAEDAKKKKAQDKYESGLSDAEKAKYEQEKKNRLAELAAQSPPPSPSTSSQHGQVAPVNSAPTDIMLSNAVISENSGIGYNIGSFEAFDPDMGETFTYELVEGTGDDDNGSFSIAGTDLLTCAPVNYESKNLYSIRVRVTDGGGLAYEKTFEIHILDVDESLTNITIDGLDFFDYMTYSAVLPSSNVIGTLVPTGGEGMITYAFTAGAGGEDNALFSIFGNQLSISDAYDDGLKGTYHIRVKATDSNNDEYVKSLTLTTASLLNVLLMSSYHGADSVTSQVYLSDITYGPFIKISGHEYLAVMNTESAGYAFWMRKNPGELYLNGNGSALEPIGEYYQFGLNLGWNRLLAQVPDGGGTPREYTFYVWVGDTPPTSLALVDITAEDDYENELDAVADGTNPFLWKVQVTDPTAIFVDISGHFADSDKRIDKVVLANGQYAEEAGTMLNGFRIPYNGTPTYAYIHIVDDDGKPYIYKLVIEPLSS